MSRDLSEVYAAIKNADAEGRTEDVKKLTAYLESLPAEEKQLDPRDLKSSLGGAAVGATAGALGVPIVRQGMKEVAKSKAGIPVVTAFDKVPAERTAFERLTQGGIDPESGTTGRARDTTYNKLTSSLATRENIQQQVLKELAEKGKLDTRKIAAAADTVGYGSTPAGVLVRPEALEAEAKAASKAMPMGQKVTQAIKSIPRDVANFGAGIANYRLPIVGAVGPMVGRGVAGGFAGMQGVDAANRFAQDDNLGGAISTVGAIGSGLSLVPHPVTRYGGAAIGFGAEALNAYLDYLKNKAQQPQQPQQEQPQEAPMPVPMAQGGLVGGLDATYNMPLAGGASLSIGGPQQQPGQPINPMMMPQMARGGLVYLKNGGFIK